MDTTDPVIRLCIQGVQAEFEHKMDLARSLYLQAWDLSQDDYQACIAAHYVARFQETPGETLHWNQEALRRAERVGDERVQEFYPSLYLNLGYSYEVLGNQAEAQKYYDLAARLGVVHQAEG
jgi:tetratricopeptide (TPR) repeat protein